MASPCLANQITEGTFAAMDEVHEPLSYDFFISNTGKDQVWAEWIARQLEASGHSTVNQAWDFKSGGVFLAHMHHALERSTLVLAALSPKYMQSDFCTLKWLLAFKCDPLGKSGRLVLVRVAKCKPLGLLTSRTYIDLFGKDPEAATANLLKRLKQGRVRPVDAPSQPPPKLSELAFQHLRIGGSHGVIAPDDSCEPGLLDDLSLMLLDQLQARLLTQKK